MEHGRGLTPALIKATQSDLKPSICSSSPLLSCLYASFPIGRHSAALDFRAVSSPLNDKRRPRT